MIGLASQANHDWLAQHGVIPVAYGDGVEERIRQAAPVVSAFIDTVGGGYVELALRLGVSPARIDTIADFAAVAEHGVKAEGNAAGASAAVLAELAGLITAARLSCRSRPRSRSRRSRTPIASWRAGIRAGRSSLFPDGGRRQTSPAARLLPQIGVLQRRRDCAAQRHRQARA